MPGLVRADRLECPPDGSDEVAASGGSGPLVSMVMACGHGACSCAILSATAGLASETLPVLLLIRCAASWAGAVQCSSMMSAAVPSATAAAPAR